MDFPSRNAKGEMHMISFGMMSLNNRIEDAYFTEIARRANPEVFTCYRFAPSKIHPVTQLVTGERFDHGTNRWVGDEFPIPKFLYDRCFYIDDIASKQSMSIVKWLKNRHDITFIGSGLPNKWAIYETLANSSLSPYIPKTLQAISGKMVVNQLRRWGKSILKPAFGSGGAGIYSLEHTGPEFVLSADFGNKLVRKSFATKKETEDWLEQLCKKKEYLLQPCLELIDAQSCPFDIRVLLQKDQTGAWSVRGKGVRRGNPDGILSNLSVGGEIRSFEEYANSLNDKSRKFLQLELDEILSKLPGILENSFPRLFELGVDIGVARDHSLWILDTNSKPGRKVVTHTNPELKEILYRAPVDYAFYLFKNMSEREEQHL
jgi:glutathione synthase/RimK-type ligase-like ATP-grasp enzyme